MRVVAGRWGGRRIAAPSGALTRPTSEKVREAVFGILLALPEFRELAAVEGTNDSVGPPVGSLAGHRVLDLFAGSGALGIEALSRGASSCTFVERNAAALRALRANLKGLLGGQAECSTLVYGCDVRRALQADARRGARYTLAFVDPPYKAYGEARLTLTRLLCPVLAPGALVVVETAARTPAELPWRTLRERRYGDTLVTVFAVDAHDEAVGCTCTANDAEVDRA